LSSWWENIQAGANTGDFVKPVRIQESKIDLSVQTGKLPE